MNWIRKECNKTLLVSSYADSVCNMLLEKDRLYIPLHDGMVTCVDLNAWSVLWNSESFGGQSLSTLYFFIVDIYTEEQPPFILLIQTEPSTVWIQIPAKQPGLIKMQKSGWLLLEWCHGLSGPVVFTGDNGTLVGHDLTTDKVYETVKLSPLSYPGRPYL